MRLFMLTKVREAQAFAEAGGQALHLSGRYRVPGKPHPVSCAHLIDRDAERLVDTARRLGVRKIMIGRFHGPGQHIDLWGGPLVAALRECSEPPPVQAALFEGGKAQ